MKNLLPFEELFYHSKLNKEELLAHLKKEIDAKKPSSFDSYKFNHLRYTGRIYNNHFEIKRKINYRNLFLPVIKGEIKDDLSGSRVIVKMGLTEYVKVFMIIWLGIVFIVCLGTANQLLFSNEFNPKTDFFMLIPFMMLLGGIAMVMIGFKTESRKSVKDLEEILQAKMIER